MKSQELLDTGGEAVGGGGVARLGGQVQVVVLDDQEGADLHDLLLDQEGCDRHQRVVVDQKKTGVGEEKPIVSVGQADGEGVLQVLRPVVGSVEGVAHTGLTCDTFSSCLVFLKINTKKDWCYYPHT